MHVTEGREPAGRGCELCESVHGMSWKRQHGGDGKEIGRRQGWGLGGGSRWGMRGFRAAKLLAVILSG